MTRFPLGFTILVGSLWLVCVSAKYLISFDESGFEHSREFYAANRLLVEAHVAAGIVVLLLGPALFLRWTGLSGRILHVLLGCTYFVAVVLVAAPTSIWLTQSVPGGTVARSGFFVLAVAWIATTLMAAIARSRKLHQAWAIRSYALSLSAISLRGIFVAFDSLGFTLAQTYPLASWLWLLNVLVGEYVIYSRFATGKRPYLTSGVKRLRSARN